ncbi:hypothetical protein AB0H83_23570 [Dactylosporangium sp. NPDC050688]|uniref:hypothetical protein n=1 Tax=Dactylosporangium sp. NPDC050688 TaxID=3157217 RepID=UPI00340CFB3D
MTVGERPDPILVLDDADYRYGAGPLVLRVEHIDVDDPITIDGELWYAVQGVQLGSGGAQRGHRRTYVRGRRIPGLT